MTIKMVWLILVIVLTIAVGQLLFKATAIEWNSEKTLLSSQVMIHLVPALLVYGIATLGWIWILQKVTLQFAYPFMAFTFVFVPIGAYVFFGERVNLVYCVGVLLIACGVIFTVISK